MINAAASQRQMGTDSYTDFSSVHAIRGLNDKNQALEEVARQFESMMMRMMMKSMRSANQVFAEGNYLSSHEGDTYQEMLDDQLALTLSQGKGMGLADVMVRQLKGRFGTTDKESDNESEKNSSDVTAYLNHRNNSTNPMSGVKSYSQNTDYDITPQAYPSINFDGSVRHFVERLYPVAEKYAKTLGVDPEVLIAQSALETGWGVKVNSKPNGDSSFNFFNIKADKRWQGDSVTLMAMEVRNGVAVQERSAFRSYTSPEQSFEDYADFILNSARYDRAVQSKDSASYIHNLSEAGYATDPDYAKKVLTIMRSDAMKQSIDAVASSTATKD